MPDAPNLNDDFLTELGDNYSRISFEPKERLMHSHGHTLQEIWALRYNKLGSYVDVVIYPRTQEHVEKIVTLANDYDVVIIPYGGGTNVTNALSVNGEEQRMVVSLDMTRMNKVLEINPENFTARVQAGIIGADLEKQLRAQGFVCGHEPDSVEFSSLGGWIATKASGMKKNKYGNIEDIVINFNLVTSVGTFKYIDDDF